MRYHSKHAPRHTKTSAHMGKQMRNMKHQLLGWVLIACLVCTTVVLPIQRTEAFVPVAAPVAAPAATSLAQGMTLIFTTFLAKTTADQLGNIAAVKACIQSFGKNICNNVSPVSSVLSAITVGAMVLSDTCKGINVVDCGKKLWEKFEKFLKKVLSGPKKSSFIQNFQKCFLNPEDCSETTWEKILGDLKPGKSQKTATSPTPPPQATASQTPPPQATASQTPMGGPEKENPKNKKTTSQKPKNPPPVGGLSPEDRKIIEKLILGYGKTIEKMEKEVRIPPGSDKAEAQEQLAQLKLELAILQNNKPHYFKWFSFEVIRPELQHYKNRLDLTEAFINTRALQRNIVDLYLKTDGSLKDGSVSPGVKKQLEEQMKQLSKLLDQIQKENVAFSKETFTNRNNPSIVQKTVAKYLKKHNNFLLKYKAIVNIPVPKNTGTTPSPQYPGIYSDAGEKLFQEIKDRKKGLATQEKRPDLSPEQKKQIKKEIERINKTKSTLADMQEKMEEKNKSGPTFSQSDHQEIQRAIGVEGGVLNTMAETTDHILGTSKKKRLFLNPLIPTQPTNSKTSQETKQEKPTNRVPENPKISNPNLSKKLLNEVYPDSGMERSNGKDALSDGVTPQYGDPSMRVETGRCVGPDNNAIVMHLLEKMSKKTVGKRQPITNLKLIQTAYGLMLQGVLNEGKTVYILPCVPIAGYNTFFVGTMAELQALLKSAQAQGNLRYGVGGKADDVVKKVTKPL